MGEVVNTSQDLCSPYHVSSLDNSSLNRVYYLITQQGRQVFGDQSKAMIATSKGGYNNNAMTYGIWVVNMEEEAMEEDILPKFAVIVERQGIPLTHAIKNVVFHLISNLKIRTIIRVMQPFTIQILTIMNRIMKVQSQKWSLNKLVLLLSSIKHC